MSIPSSHSSPSVVDIDGCKRKPIRKETVASAQNERIYYVNGRRSDGSVFSKSQILTLMDFDWQVLRRYSAANPASHVHSVQRHVMDMESGAPFRQ